jgi:hypothetical protein
LVSRRDAKNQLGVLIANKRIRLPRAGQTRTTLQINPTARKRLRGRRRADGWLETSAKDRYGLVAALRQQVKLRR